MRVLIFTSSGGTAHDVAAYALRDWLQQLVPGSEVRVDQELERDEPWPLVLPWLGPFSWWRYL